MALSRRNFVITAGAAATYALYGADVSLGQTKRALEGSFAPVASTTDPINFFSAAQFEPLVGTTFATRMSSGERVTLTLLEVKDRTRKQNLERGYSGDCYTLLFESSNGDAGGEIYEFNNRFLGKFSLFISPVGPGPRRYEAVINRIAR
jgi:hypothetical protein